MGFLVAIFGVVLVCMGFFADEKTLPVKYHYLAIGIGAVFVLAGLIVAKLTGEE